MAAKIIDQDKVILNRGVEEARPECAWHKRTPVGLSDDAGKVLKGTVLDKADAAVPQRISDEEIALASVRRRRAVGHCRILQKSSRSVAEKILCE